MTTIKSRKDYDFKGRKVFVEQYQDKEMFVPMWRYGELTDANRGYVIKDGLTSRPNLKRLFGTK